MKSCVEIGEIFNCSSTKVNTWLIKLGIETRDIRAAQTIARDGWTGHEEIAGAFWNRTQKGAKKRNISFDIKIEDAWDLFLKQDKKCALTGVELQMWVGYKENRQTASIDRIDSTKGYTLDNIQWVHKRINIMKSNMTEDEFYEWCKKHVEYKECQQKSA